MQTTGHTDFVEGSQRRYASMRRRFGKLPFTLDRFRQFLIDTLGGEQGLTRCEYCNTPVSILTLELDHRLSPKSQGGSLDLDNLAPACACCNQQKGEMSSPAFVALRAFVFHDSRFTSVDRVDLFGRLQSQLKLALREQARRHASRKASSIRISPIRHSRSA
jgi:hypothetical protein